MKQKYLSIFLKKETIIGNIRIISLFHWICTLCIYLKLAMVLNFSQIYWHLTDKHKLFLLKLLLSCTHRLWSDSPQAGWHPQFIFNQTVWDQITPSFVCCFLRRSCYVAQPGLQPMTRKLLPIFKAPGVTGLCHQNQLSHSFDQDLSCSLLMPSNNLFQKDLNLLNYSCLVSFVPKSDLVRPQKRTKWKLKPRINHISLVLPRSSRSY